MGEEGYEVDRAGAAKERADGNVARSGPTEVPIDGRLSIAMEEDGRNRSVGEREIPGLDKAQHAGLGGTVAKERETEDVSDEGLERVTPGRVRPKVGEGVDDDVPQPRITEKEIESKTIEPSCIGTPRPKMGRALEHLGDNRDQQRTLIG